MKVRLKANLVVITAESAAETVALAEWAQRADGHVFACHHQDGQTFRLTDLGPRPEACREPINVVSTASDPTVRLISNLAHTPFELDGRVYASVEAFWQGLKFPDEKDRLRVVDLHGQEARRAGETAAAPDPFAYGGRLIRVGTRDHWDLMFLACRAKFSQHAEARAALLSTGTRPLTHRTRRDSRSIPGAIMADIWMRLRRSLQGLPEETSASPEGGTMP